MTVPITDFCKFYAPTDVMRYGIVPNDITFATTNTTRLAALFDSTITGAQGITIFPPLIGNDTYHLNGRLELRDKTHWNLMGCRLLWTVTAAVSDKTYGCINAIRDILIENGAIEANISGTVGGGALPLVRLGPRTGYPFGSFTGGIAEADDLALPVPPLPPMGNIVFRNIRFKTNNLYANCASMVVLLGGLRNVTFENCTFEGNGNTGPEVGIYYEMGDGSKNGFPSTPAKWSTSSAINLQFRNISGKNLKLDGSSDAGVISIVEANSFTIDGVFGDSVRNIVSSRVGEGHYRTWDGNKTAGPRIGIVRNVTGVNIPGIGVALSSAQDTPTGTQFADDKMIAAGLTPLTKAEKVDLIQYVLEGFDIQCTPSGTGIVLGGPCVVRSGSIRGAFNGIYVQGECVSFDISRVTILGSAGVGLRADTDSTLFSRKKIGRITGCKIAGSAASHAISIEQAQSVYVGQNQLGYSLAYDNADESTQFAGVVAATNSRGVICDGNFVTPSGGAVAYSLASIAGSDESGGCGIINALGTVTYAGKWRGVVQTATPTLTCATPGNLSVTYGFRTLTYVRSIDGARVDYSFRIETSAFTYTTASGVVSITGLPYTALGTLRTQGSLTFSGVTKANYTQFTPEPSPAGNAINIFACGSTQATALLAITDLPTGGSVVLRGAGHYHV